MMESYLMMLYVTLDQESALKSFFLEQGWTFCKPDLSMITDKLGPATFHPATKTPLSETYVEQTVVENTRKRKIVENTRKRKVNMPLKAPVMKIAKVLSSTRVTSVRKSAGSPQLSGTKQPSAGSPQQSGTKQPSAGSPQQSGLKQLRTGLIKEPGTQKLSTSVPQQSQKVSKGTRNKGKQEKLCEQSETSAFGEPSMREVKVEVDKLNKENADDGDDDDSSSNDRDDADDYLSDSSHVEPNSGLSVGDLNRRLKPNREKKPYDRENLKRAFEATLSGMSVYSASRLYGVPESTLRDRTRQKVDIDCQYGGIRIFSECEEKQLVDHIVYMAKIGYGYTITDIQYIAGDFARSLGKTVRAKDALSQGWMYSFLGRWEELKVIKPQKLGISRAKSATKETVTNYFTELGSLLMENDLLNAPERIYYIDETGFSTEHTPLEIVCGSDTKAQAVTSARSKTVSVIGGANALGNHVPPFYIFPGKRWCEGLLEGAAPGSDGDMSESGFVNRSLFETYLTGHFAKHVGLINGANKPSTLVLYDGHKSHVSLTLTNWAKDHSVILFVLPPHSSHLTQPLDTGVFGPMKNYYNHECTSYMHANPGVHITRYDVARLTAVPYARAFSPENIMSAFRKAGIYPFDSELINETQTAPSSIYPTQPENYM